MANTKEITIDFYELKFSKKISNENQKLKDLFLAELNNQGDYSAPIPQTYKVGEIEYSSNGYFKGTFINSKYYNLPLASNASRKEAKELPLTNEESLGFAT